MKWQDQGMPIKVYMDKTSEDTIEPGEYPDDLNDLFGYGERADFPIGMLGWCEPPFVPEIKPELIESTDEYDIVRDEAGRTVRFKKGHKPASAQLKNAVKSTIYDSRLNKRALSRNTLKSDGKLTPAKNR